MRMRDKVTVITGGASGIGLATVERCLEEGARVILADRSQSEGAQRADELARHYGDRCRFIQVDVTSTEQVNALFAETKAQIGPVDCVFSNAGIGAQAPAVEVSDDDMLRVIDVNLNGVFRVARAALQIMTVRGSGSIVNCASGLGTIARPNLASYVASKGGVLSLTRALAVEAAAHNVRVNALSPGYVDTPLIAHNSEERRKLLVSLHPIGRLATPREIANAALFLMSDEASFVTGANLNVDGGYTIGKP